MKHIHLIGIGGAGLSAIARVLLERGYLVSGSDLEHTPIVESLVSAGARFYVGHHSDNVRNAEIVVRSSAVPDENIEVQAARSRGIMVVKRAEFLGELMEGKTVIAVSGTHGKTTTTAMISWMLSQLGLDPSFILGGVISNLGTNARAGRGASFVIEADEYDRMFLGLKPKLAVITNVEYDHPDCYPTMEEYQDAFRSFVKKIIPGGILILCGDDPLAEELGTIANDNGNKYFTYGYQDRSNDYLATELKLNPDRMGYEFHLNYKGKKLADLRLQVPGLHNVFNASAAMVLADQLGLQPQNASDALSRFEGTERRLEIIAEPGGVIVISDYAHHPTEIRATLSAVRSCYPDRDIHAVWQPHTYSRTKLFFDAFTKSFDDADFVHVMEIFASREPVEGEYSANRLVDAIQHPQAKFTPSISDTVEVLEKNLKAGDVVIILSAGNADQICAHIVEAFGQKVKEVENAETEEG